MWTYNYKLHIAKFRNVALRNRKYFISSFELFFVTTSRIVKFGTLPIIFFLLGNPEWKISFGHWTIDIKYFGLNKLISVDQVDSLILTLVTYWDGQDKTGIKLNNIFKYFIMICFIRIGIMVSD